MKRPEPLDLLPLTHVTYHVMLALADRPLHGYGIIKEIAERTDGRMDLEAGTLYAAIKRLVDDALLEVAPRDPEDTSDQRRRYYRLTVFGREVLRAESARMVSLIAVAREKQVIASGSGRGG